MNSERRAPNGVAELPNPDERAPSSESFCHRVLDNMPGALLIVDPLGTVIYGNRALASLTGHALREGEGKNVMDYVHPDDQAWLIDSFIGVTESITTGTATRGVPIPNDEDGEIELTPWASINFRMITATGETLPVEVSGISGLHDPVIGGILYDVRPATGQELMQRVFNGLGTKEPVKNLLRMVLDMIAMRPLDLDAVVLESTADGGFVPLVSNSTQLFELVTGHVGALPWNEASATPVHVNIETLDGPLGDGLRDLGHLDMWHIAVESSMMSTTYRIVVSSRDRQVPATGTLFRIQRAAELAGIVLFRSHADELLSHAATHDALTGLPNRSGFYDRINESMLATPIALLFFDIDGLKPINDLFGHHAGDVVLQQTALRVRLAIGLDDVVCRLGGDEFAVVIHSDPGSSSIDMDHVRAVATSVLAHASLPIDIGTSEVQVSASIGAAVANSPMEVDYLLSRADAAMYEAKREGGNKLRIDSQLSTEKAA